MVSTHEYTLYFRPDSALWVTFHGFPGVGDEGFREIIPIYDLTETPYCCSEAAGEYEHFVRRGDGSERIFDYAGRCATVAGQHAHPGSGHGQP